MVNSSGITKTSGVSKRQILLNVEHQFSLGVVVGDTGAVTVGAQKIQKAGTPLYGNIDTRTTAFVPATTSGEPAASNAVAVLLHDVDVTSGSANGTALFWGFVNTNRLDTDVKALITAPVKTALTKITFVAE